MLGRATSILNLPRVALEPVSLAATGVLASIDIRWLFAAAALPMLVVALSLGDSPSARHMTVDG